MLPPDLIEHISRYLLLDDVVDYISFRAVCSEWRPHTASPCSFATCFRPRQWLMLSDKDAEPSTPRRFLNLSTGRFLLIALPELESHSIVFCCEGLLLLLDMKRHGIMRLFNPFMRQLSADYPPFHTGFQFKDYPAHIRKYKCLITDDDCPTLLLYQPWMDQNYSKPGDDSWQEICLKDEFKFISRTLFFRGKFYCVSSSDAICLLDTKCNLVTPVIPLVHSVDIFGPYLVESDGGLLVVRRKGRLVAEQFEIFRINLESKTLTKLKNLGEYALFINFNKQTFWVSLKLPSIKSNSVYYTNGADNQVVIYNLHDQSTELVETINYREKLKKGYPLLLVDHIMGSNDLLL